MSYLKRISSIILVAATSIAQAQQRTSLYKKEVTHSPITKNQSEKPDAPKSKTSAPAESNLPAYFKSGARLSIEESPVVLPGKNVGVQFKQLKVGDLATATITESVFAFYDSKAPVRALIKSGVLKGSVLVGEANLERNSKRILVDFKKFRDPASKELYLIQAAAMDEKGVLGLEGRLVSNEGVYFAAEVLSAGAAGYADSTIERNQNLMGNQQEVKNSDTYAKKAITSAFSKSADRFSEKLKQAPEYAVINGPIEIQILVLEQPKLTTE